MKTKIKLNHDILKVMLQIEKYFPELSGFMGEMPVKISDSNERGINNKNLKDYYDSLEALVRNYTLYSVNRVV